MTRTKSTYLALLAVLLSPMAANADLINATANLTDNGTYTTDNSTRLDWLDLSVTANFAYLSAESNNPGWRYATNSEVEGLFAMFFEPNFVGDENGYQESTAPDSLAEAALFISLIGATIDNDPRFSALGYYLDEDDILRAMGAEMDIDVVTGIVGPEWFLRYGGSARVAYGTYLVRTTTVPEPGTFALFGLGLFGLAVRGRKKI